MIPFQLNFKRAKWIRVATHKLQYTTDYTHKIIYAVATHKIHSEIQYNVYLIKTCANYIRIQQLVLYSPEKAKGTLFERCAAFLIGRKQAR